MILSALRLVFPDKKKSWYEQPFLRSQEGAAKYWIKVVERRGELWRTALKKREAREEASLDPNEAVRRRIRDKIKHRLQRKVSDLAEEGKGGSTVKPIPISSGSDSDDPPTAVKSSSSPSAGSSTKKLVPAPSTYTRAEIKSFARMARTIRQFNERVGHSPATANFLDVEFSNNTGKASRLQRSKMTWKRNRFDAACLKAAKILEDRFVIYISRPSHVAL